MIRVVIDTNILVSALLQPSGLPAQVFVLAERFNTAVCERRGLCGIRRGYQPQRDGETIAATLRSIRERAFWVKPTDPVRACSDPDDDIFLECAQAAQADYIVTGNLKHFPEAWEGTRIVPPRRLLEVIQPADKETE